MEVRNHNGVNRFTCAWVMADGSVWTLIVEIVK
jgi:hypothetical protein